MARYAPQRFKQPGWASAVLKLGTWQHCGAAVHSLCAAAVVVPVVLVCYKAACLHLLLKHCQAHTQSVSSSQFVSRGSPNMGRYPRHGVQRCPFGSLYSCQARVSPLLGAALVADAAAE